MTLNPTLNLLGQGARVKQPVPEKARVRVQIQQRPRPEPVTRRQPPVPSRSVVTQVDPPVTAPAPVAKAPTTPRRVVIQQPRLPEPTVPRAEPAKSRVLRSQTPRVTPSRAEPPAAFPPPTPVAQSPEEEPPGVPPPATTGVIPERAAVPKGSFPNANIRKTLSRLGSKTSIELHLKIHPDGHIDVEVVTSSGEPELDRVVLQDLKGWRWEPARSAGRPVYSEKNLRLKLEAD